MVGKLGTATTTPQELGDRLDGPLRGRKVQSWGEGVAAAKAAQGRGDTVVFTNGCFDILHHGHIDYLRKARALGSRLVVGLNSDASTKRLKGPSRPVNREGDRAELLAALEFVDQVIIFDQDTPLELIRELRPNILVKGGDYKPESIVGREYAGQTLTIPFVDGYSTTKIIETMKTGGAS